MKSTELQAIKQKYNIVGNCDALNHVLDVAMQVAPTDLSVLIIGESGVGKEIIPRIIHDSSPRRREKYFAINCGSIPEGTIDSELFGHVKGSYTGAFSDSPGYFGVANKGTLFLDEVGELPLATQARLLRVLENGEYIPVGATEVRKTDVRIVAATNVNIQKAISEGRFREDLYYRLNEVAVQMPPLRERGEDIVLLFRLFAMQMAEKYKMDRVQLTDEAKQMLMRYKWPGNVRQLKNITQQISVLSQERLITPDVLMNFIPQDRESTQLAVVSQNGSDHSFENEREILYKILFELRGNVNDMRREMGQLKKQIENVREGGAATIIDSTPTTAVQPVHAIQPAQPVQAIQPIQPVTSQLEDAIAEEYVEPTPEKENLNLDDISRQMLVKALERNNGNRKKAAQELGISDRTLYRRLKLYGMTVCILLLSLLTMTACSVSYKFNGASIDYTKTKTIQINDFPIRSAYVWGPMANIFNNQLKDQYANHTKLIQVKRNGDLRVDGEITRYEQRNKAVSAEGYSAQTELSMTVNVRFTNNANHAEDFERQFTATSTYETTQSLNAVQEELVTQMVKDITDQIFNATVANW
ncbi:MAG: sigma 54-interacting transcriptional regulator [Prevotella sp.]|nr:sigma 54-interacting transcriptional regulator [Prevotella sp.]